MTRALRCGHGFFASICVATVFVAFPTTAVAADPAEGELAEKYAPVVRLVEQEEDCGSGEPYDPIEVDLILGNDEVAFRGPWDTTNLVAVGPTADLLATGRDGYHLDFPGDPLDAGCDYETWARRISDEGLPTTYARVVTEPGRPGQLALQYWFFYVYNDFNNKHEGDWEMIQLVFDATDASEALTTNPVAVGYSQHEGAERAVWGEKKLEVVGGTHLVVYPAAGSHANYYEPALFLGRSAAQGVGCDDTLGPHRELDPAVASVPTDQAEYLAEYPWLGYQGRWGEQQPSFYNGPTGPNQKSQWTEPITWSETEWRDASFAIPAGETLGPAATDFFCGAVAAGSNLLIRIVRNPVGVGVFFAALLALLLWAASRTTWESSAPLRLARRRAWGQIVSATRRMYTSRFLKWVLVGVVFVPVLIVATAIQALIFHLSSLANLVDAAGEANGFVALLVVGLGTAFALVALTFVQAATVVVLVAIDEGREVTIREVYRAVLAHGKGLLVTLALVVVIVLVLLATVIGVPFAVWLVFRWSFLAQALVLEGLPPVRALRRSSQLVRGRWWRVATIVLFTTGLALVLGPLIGVGLLFFTDAAFNFVNLVSSIVYTIAMPFAAIATTYLYFDCRVREKVEPVERRPVETLPAEI